MNADIEKRSVKRSQHMVSIFFCVVQQKLIVLQIISSLCLTTSQESSDTWQICCRYGDFGQMFELMLRQAPEEQWDMVYPVDDEWPSADQMASYQVGVQQILLRRFCGIDLTN